MSGLRPCCSHPKSTRFMNSSLISTRAGSTALNFDDGISRLNAVDCIYGTTYAYIYIHTYIQTRLTFYTSMWGSLRLAPICAQAGLSIWCVFVCLSVLGKTVAVDMESITNCELST